MKTANSIGETLVRARRAQGMSQRALGERLSTTQQQIARWEATAYRAASLEKVSAAAEALGVVLGAADRTLPIAPRIPLVAETTARYLPYSEAAVRTPPVRDLAEIAARIRVNGAVFRDRFGISRIGVFGSFVFGEQTPDSDVDLLFDFSNRPRGFTYIEIGEFAEKVLGRTVDYTQAHLLRERLRNRVLSEVVYVWQA